MALTDKTLTCRDCGNSFTFTVGEQEFYQSRGLQMSPVGARSVGWPGDRVALRATVNQGKCTQQYVPSAVLNARCLLSPEKIDQFIAVPVTRR